MALGAFSVSLAVKYLEVSVALYRKLGFEIIAGHEEQNWLILCSLLPDLEDVRCIQKRLKAAGGIEFTEEADESTTGPACFSIVDPDGNPILFDQHV